MVCNWLKTFSFHNKRFILISLLFFILGTGKINAQWIPANGPGGVLINSLAICNVPEGTYIFAGTQLGVYRTSNNGISWQLVNSGITPNMTIYTLLFNGTDLYAGTNNEVYRSTNYGESWNFVLYGLEIHSMCRNSNYIFAGTLVTGIYRSSNNGVNWGALGLADHNIHSLFADGNIIYIGADQGRVLYSSNDGTGWTAVPTGFTNFNINCFTAKEDYLFAGSGGGGILRSTNNGNNWTINNSGLTNLNITSLSSLDTNIVAGTSEGGIFLSTDYGNNWFAVNTGNLNKSINAFAVNNTSIYAGTSGGAYYSPNNGNNWTEINGGLCSYNFISLACLGDNILATTGPKLFRSSNNGISWNEINAGINVHVLTADGTKLYAGEIGVYISTNYGTTWIATNNGLNDLVSAIAVKGSNIFGGTYLSGLYRSTNNGADWVHMNIPIPNIPAILSVAINGTNVYAGTDRGFFLSTNNGDTWSSIPNGWPIYATGSCIVIVENVLYAGCGLGIYRSTNNGASWTNANIYADVKLLANNGPYIFAGTNISGVLVSTNSGINWTYDNTGLNYLQIISLAVSGRKVFAATVGGGIYIRSDIIPVELTSFTSSVSSNDVILDWESATEINTLKYEVERKQGYDQWNKISEVKAAGNSVTPNSYLYKDKKLNSGSYYYRLKIVDYDGSYDYSKETEAIVGIPDKFYLSQNYPNPFNPETKISYTIPVESKVTLKIFDLLGSEIAELVNEAKPAGIYEVTFNAANLVSGIYIYRLQSGSFTETKKLCLIK